MPAIGVALPRSFARSTGDLDAMVKRRNIRALVIVNPIGFFYVQGQPKGAIYEAIEEFQKFVNQKLKTGKLRVTVTFLPMRADQLEAALTQGVGDMIANGIVVTPDREKRVAFSTPIEKDPNHRNRTKFWAGLDFGRSWREGSVCQSADYLLSKSTEDERAASKGGQA